LDYSSMSANDGLFTKSMNWDHDMVQDTSRRDFTCNALYYDTKNEVILDPTGHGIADAQNKVLRLAPSKEEADKNRCLHVRFWKFRARGYTPEAETLDYIKKHADKWWTALQEDPQYLVSDIYKAIGKGGDPKKNLAKFKDAMEADGALWLYDKHVKKWESKIINYALEKGPE